MVKSILKKSLLKLNIINLPENIISKQEFLGLISFACEKLQINAIKGLEIEIVFKENYVYEIAYCEWINFTSKPTKFKITFCKLNMAKRSITKYLLHEMVHVAQYATYKMTYNYRYPNKFKFNKKTYYKNVLDGEDGYWLKDPCEIEARGLGIGLEKVCQRDKKEYIN